LSFRQAETAIFKIDIMRIFSGRGGIFMDAGGRTRRKVGSSLRERIAREIEAHKRRGSKLEYGPYLNNFHCHLPGGLYRLIAKRTDVNEPYTNPGASRKRREMTRAQFSGVIDALIAELGLDAEKIKNLQLGRNEDIHDYAFALYVRLREEGFKHYPDLTA
jgi:hypothetical protein